MKQPAIYIMTNMQNGTLYTGVTSNLGLRIYQHKTGQGAGFTKRYNCKMLVYYEHCDTMPNAIEREKQIKAGSRKMKLALIESMNPEWNDLYDGLA
ncbi:MAG TPA: endonuclease [Rhodospirillaceae bacterium]|nr:endonuclease [Rhodospirillaceae bacterium]